MRKSHASRIVIKSRVAILVVVSIALLLAVPALQHFCSGVVAIMSGATIYGGWGQVGRGDYSFLAGREEEGWFAQTYHGSFEMLWGTRCIDRIRRGHDQSDDVSCPCLSITRGPLQKEMARKLKNGGRDTGGHGLGAIFYLKLHKAGSTTVTNALVNRCMEVRVRTRTPFPETFSELHSKQNIAPAFICLSTDHG